ncbi:hypothetical protein OEZ79_26400, partial [Leclercia adecarboxylata]
LPRAATTNFWGYGPSSSACSRPRCQTGMEVFHLDVGEAERGQAADGPGAGPSLGPGAGKARADPGREVFGDPPGMFVGQGVSAQGSDELIVSR